MSGNGMEHLKSQLEISQYDEIRDLQADNARFREFVMEITKTITSQSLVQRIDEFLAEIPAPTSLNIKADIIEENMPDKTKPEEAYRPQWPWMTDDQWECAQLLANVHHGFNHMFGKIHPWGKGIKLNSTCSNNLATYDFNGLTRLVVLAHEQLIRVEITPSGPGMIGFIAHKRHSRDGRMHERHPTIEQATQDLRKQPK